MKVLCINAKQIMLEVPFLVEGAIYEILPGSCGHGCCYQLEDGFYYKKERFVPISDIDETELIKEREQVTA